MTPEERRRILAVVEERIVVLEGDEAFWPTDTVALMVLRDMLQELRRVTEELTR